MFASIAQTSASDGSSHAGCPKRRVQMGDLIFIHALHPETPTEPQKMLQHSINLWNSVLGPVSGLFLCEGSEATLHGIRNHRVPSISDGPGSAAMYVGPGVELDERPGCGLGQGEGLGKQMKNPCRS